MKTACIYHSIDLDGWMSAAIVKYWFNLTYSCISSNSILDTTVTGDTLTFIGYNYGQPIPDLSEYDKVIMCDISFSKEEMINLYDRLDDNFIYIDHHISIIRELQQEVDKGNIHHFKGFQHTDYAACELTWKYFFSRESMPEIVRLLGRYDCFGHKFTKENQDRLDTLLDVRDNSFTEQLHPYQEELNYLLNKKNEETKVLEFQYGARQCISNYEEAYKYLIREFEEQIDYPYKVIDNILESGKAIYQYLCTEAKQAYKNGFPIHLFEDSKGEKTIGEEHKLFICINKERFNPINFGIDYHKDGYDGCACFHFDGTHWCFSLYNDNGLVDCSQIAKQFGGGGHKGAAGFKLNFKDIDIDSFLRPRMQ